MARPTQWVSFALVILVVEFYFEASKLSLISIKICKKHGFEYAASS